jgi:hypothetical protein
VLSLLEYHWSLRSLKLCDVVFEREALNELLFVLVDAPHDIVSHSDIKSIGVLGQDVDVVTIPLHDLSERSFAFAQDDIRARPSNGV